MSKINCHRSRSRKSSPPNEELLDQLCIRPFLGCKAEFNAVVLEMIVRALKTPKLCNTAYRLLPVLASMMNCRTGHCYPGVSKLASELGVSPQAIRKACRDLEEAGLIHVDLNSSSFNTNSYYLDFRKLEKRGPSFQESQSISQAPVTGVSPDLIKEVFGETNVALLCDDDIDALHFAEERSRSRG
ncbi:helix-turn-helix domain-containing protein [Hoeflea sp. TYP-13]|uniref:helix-turn-helix domain-containing protein n=1 Tax=Hoeflea sp. TYP-13 TaxID=3230023 RepID=UPI0034C690B2